MKCSRVALSLLLAVLGGVMLTLGPANEGRSLAADFDPTSSAYLCQKWADYKNEVSEWYEKDVHDDYTYEYDDYEYDSAYDDEIGEDKSDKVDDSTYDYIYEEVDDTDDVSAKHDEPVASSEEGYVRFDSSCGCEHLYEDDVEYACEYEHAYPEALYGNTSAEAEFVVEYNEGDELESQAIRESETKEELNEAYVDRYADHDDYFELFDVYRGEDEAVASNDRESSSEEGNSIGYVEAQMQSRFGDEVKAVDEFTTWTSGEMDNRKETDDSQDHPTDAVSRVMAGTVITMACNSLDQLGYAIQSISRRLKNYR